MERFPGNYFVRNCVLSRSGVGAPRLQRMDNRMKQAWTIGLTGLIVAGVAFSAGARPELSAKRSSSLLARVPNVRDIANRPTSLSRLAGPKGLVVAFTSTSCP
ncbi:MAG: hypothetical protein RLZZ78_1901, partial [Armatimonadota bacterium]